MFRYLVITTLLIACSGNLGFAEKPVLKLVYKDIGKPPYMQAYPDNSGLYFDILNRAVEKIGFRLVVLRLPKKRTYRMLEKGEADLYPSGVFKNFRSEFLYYFPNGLSRYEIYYGFTSIEIPEITKVSEINNYNLQWFVELGGSDVLEAKRVGVKYFEVKDVRVDKAVALLSGKRPAFFKIIKADLENYMAVNKIGSMKDIGMRLHKNCFKPMEKPLYIGFSKRSPYYKVQPNVLYDKTKPVSAENYPFEPVPGSVPDKLKKVLQEMIESGEIAALKQKYGIK